MNYIGIAETERANGRCQAAVYFGPNGFTGSSDSYARGLQEVCCSAYGQGLFVEKEFEE